MLALAHSKANARAERLLVPIAVPLSRWLSDAAEHCVDGDEAGLPIYSAFHDTL